MINVNQITSQLAKMPDQLLQKFAAMHKNDPYTVSLALSESNRRKDLRSAAQARMAGQQMPKVVDQEVAQMAPVDAMGNVTGALPEDVGIGQLPAQNLRKMAGGGIVAFDEGGEVPRFQNRGEVQDPFRNASRELTELVLATAAKYNIDPSIAMRLVKQESGFDPNARSKAGAVGLTQLMPDTAKEMGLTEEERSDPVKNVNAGFGYLRKQLNKYGEDYSKALSAYNWGGRNVDTHLRTNDGQLNKIGLPKETANYLTKILPMGSAGAGELPKEGAAKATPAAPAAPVDNRPWYDRGRDLMMSGEAQRAMLQGVQDVPAALVGAPVDLSYYIANQFGRKPIEGEKPLMGSKWIKEKLEGMGLREAESANPDLRAIRSATEGVASLYNPLDKATQATKMTKEGIAALAAENKAADAARSVRGAQEAGATLDEQKYLADMANARREALAAEAPTKAASIQKANEIAAAQRAPVGRDLNPVGEAALLANTDVDAAAAAVAADRKKAAPEGVELDKAAIDKIRDGAAGAAAPEKKGGISDLFNDPMFILGMNMMANKDPSLLGAVGTAGLSTAKTMAEQRKAESERGYAAAKAAEAQATADLYNRGAKDRNMALEAEKLVQGHMQKWSSSPAGQLAGLQNAAAVQAEEDRVRQRIYRELGISPTMMSGAPTPSLSAADAALVKQYLKR